VYVPGATFLNDVAVDADGNVYTSDTRQGKIYRYANGEISVYLDNPDLKGVNGLLCKPGQLWILAAGGIYTYDQASQHLQLFSDAVKGGDGLTAVNDSDFLASRWVGEVYYVHGDGSADKLLDTQNDHKNTADIDYVADKHLLVIPTFTGNTVAGYTLNP
jgi:sugar lactone lactonase YvrE